jgi:hypothetical protein
MTLVSVVMPCHNGEAYVAEAMESALAQTYQPLELVVVDDASTDASWAVIEEVAARHPGRVTALRLERNRGGCHARNLGAATARGRFLMFLDSDDGLRPDAIAALVEAVRDRPDGVAMCDWRHLELEDGEWRETPASVPLPEPGADLFRVWLEGSAWAPTSCVLWRRDVYERTGGWDEALAREQDDDLMLRAYSLGARLVLAEGGLAYYRLQPGLGISVTRGVAIEKLQSSVRVVETLWREIQRHGRADELQALVGNVYHQLALRGFQQGHTELARECLRRGDEMAGPRILSPKRVGRALERLLGLERKERVVQALARYGVATPARRQAFKVRKLFARIEPQAQSPSS